MELLIQYICRWQFSTQVPSAVICLIGLLSLDKKTYFFPVKSLRVGDTNGKYIMSTNYLYVSVKFGYLNNCM